MSGALGRARLSTPAARTVLERDAPARMEISARVRLDSGELPKPTSRTRAEYVTYNGELVTYRGEPVWILVAA